VARTFLDIYIATPTTTAASATLDPQTYMPVVTMTSSTVARRFSTKHTALTRNALTVVQHQPPHQ
jgi:hypothetical protein